MQPVTLHIEGMNCSHCLNAVNHAVRSVPGVKVKHVQMGRADVDVPATGSINDLISAIEAAGYVATTAAPN